MPLTADEIEEMEKPVVRTSRKMLRHEMTEEQREREKQRDRERYAKKRNTRIAAVQAKRAEILQDTSFAV